VRGTPRRDNLPGMRFLGSFALIMCACGSGSGPDNQGTLVTQDGASDEVYLAMLDAEERGEITGDDLRAALVSEPTDGASIPVASPVTVRWALPAQAPRHGIATGQFVWLRLSGDGLAEPIDVLSLSTTSYTPDAAIWTALQAATGPITITSTTAYSDDGILQTGPFRPLNKTTFTIAE
jgi:hypothetical protein